MVSGILRSESMKQGTLIIPCDRARKFINLLGADGLIQLVDMNEKSINRAYKKYIQRIDSMEQILRFLFEELYNLPNAKVIRGPIEDFYKDDYNYNLEKVEEILEKLYQQFCHFKANNEDLLQQRNNAILKRSVALVAMTHLKQATFVPAPDPDNASESLLGDQEMNGDQINESCQKQYNNLGCMTFSNLAGVINSCDQERLSRVLFRTTRGNTYTYFQSILEPFMDHKKGQNLKKSVFVVYYQGSITSFLHEKILKICAAFSADMYDWPKSYDDAKNLVAELDIMIEDKEKALQAYKSVVFSEVSTLLEPIREGGSSLIEEWRLFCLKEKSIYTALNKFEGSDITLRADCWYPEKEEERIRQILNAESNYEQVSAFLLSDSRSSRSKTAPTYIVTNEFTSAFQSFVNTYGIPRYREANPALLTIITLPFLFGIMYGDIGHGLCLTAFALFLVFYQRMNSDKINYIDETSKIIVNGRYMILLMGLFATYAGFIYNDFFSMSINIFDSRWKSVNDQMIPGDDFPYPFGVDPKWKGSSNELSYTNSLKMKFSVIVAFLHMGSGLMLKGLNSLHFKDHLTFFFEFIPQIIFLSSFVGYLNFLIVYKWLMPANHNKPLLITTIISMCMFSAVEEANELFSGQETVQKCLMVILILSIPVMLFMKPLVIFYRMKMKKRHLRRRRPSEVLSSMNDDPTEYNSLILNVLQTGDAKDHDEYSVITSSNEIVSRTTTDEGVSDSHTDFTDVCIHQVIETIEFVLGVVSNTASYLRLWALSLAHQQLSLIFLEKTILLALKSFDNIYLLSIALLFATIVFSAVTFGVIICMDSLECFLHALRLQWVEFQNKFFKADGVLYEPLNFAEILKSSDDDMVKLLHKDEGSS